MYWLYTEVEMENTAAEAMVAAATMVGVEVDMPANIALVPEPYLKDSLKARIQNICKLGRSRTKTVYFASWERMKDKIDHQYSHLFMTSTTVSNYLKKLVLQYRYGLLPTYKVLKRYKKSDSSICPLCGHEDGGHHAMSGCSKLLKKAALRHNNAGILIVEAIYTGEHGQKLIAADVRLNKRRRAKGQHELDMH
jgi:hypothetical protein